MRSPHETHGIMPTTYKFHDPHTITTTCYLNIEFSCTFSTNQTESLMSLMLTYKFQCILLIQLIQSHQNHARSIYITTLKVNRDIKHKSAPFSPRLEVLA